MLRNFEVEQIEVIRLFSFFYTVVARGIHRRAKSS